MNCACDVDTSGEVISACGAHLNWFRKETFNICTMPYHKQVPAMEAEAKYMKKAQGVLLGLLVEKLGVEVDES